MKKWMILISGILLISCQTKSCRNTSEGVSLEKGKLLYEMHCASCHGVKGDGKGPIAQYLWPKPRDFTSGIFKFRTNRGPVPSDLDLLQTMKIGIPGTSMPGWDLLGMEEWRSILNYVKSFSPRLLNEKPGPSLDIPEEPKVTQEAIKEGEQLYQKSGCSACHGAFGTGDGPGAIVLKDVWGDSIAPRDLTRGPLKWGNTSRDIYRSLMVGIPGTPMPAFEHTFTKQQLWALVHYLQTIQRKFPEGQDPSSPKRHLISVKKVEGEIPMEEDANTWLETKAAPIFLKTLWHEPKGNEWLNVKAVHNEKEIAFYIQWEDEQMNIGTDQKDAVAIQFPLESISNPVELPYLGMGNKEKPVNIWEWKAGEIRDLNAFGVGSLIIQDKDGQNLSGKGVYNQGSWHVILKRSLKPIREEDATFQTTGYLSFGLFDADLPTHKGPEAFSEWMMYELR